MENRLNIAEPMIMHIDLNSCFASIEQQSRPLLRNRPVAVVNRRTEKTSIVTASYEAKARGVKVGMKVATARLLCPTLTVVESDPAKYIFVHKKLANILNTYSPKVAMKSIDEGLIDFSHSPPHYREIGLTQVGREIKQRIHQEIGEYINCSIGIGTNRFLAKVASGLNKPDGLVAIAHHNLKEIYQQMELEDLHGIADGFATRLRRAGIASPLDFLEAEASLLADKVFKSKCGYDWYRRLRGWEVDDIDYGVKSIGRQFVLDQRQLSHGELLQRFHSLTEDLASRLRSQKLAARGVRVYIKTYQSGRWQNFSRQDRAVNDERSLFMIVKGLLLAAPLPAYEIGVTCYLLISDDSRPLDLFGETVEVDRLTKAIDSINNTWGKGLICSANTLEPSRSMSRKISFGGTRGL